MIRVLVLALLTSPICSMPGFRPSVMYGEKPILRLGPDEYEPNEPQNAADVNGEQPDVKEPQWVTNLRTNIQKQINEAGFEDAKPDIKTLIDEANANVNEANGATEGDQNNPEVRVPVKVPLRNGPLESGWEYDLKAYIKELINTYGNKGLERYVKPVISSIERKHHVIIRDIDGIVSVKYDRRGRNSNFPDPRYYQRERSEIEPRYTISPE